MTSIGCYLVCNYDVLPNAMAHGKHGLLNDQKALYFTRLIANDGYFACEFMHTFAWNFLKRTDEVNPMLTGFFSENGANGFKKGPIWD